MKREIIPGKNFRTYVKDPLIADDTLAYNIIWDLGGGYAGSEFLITAFREDGQVISDAGTIEKGVAKYVLANNMYSVEGQTELRLSIVTGNTTLTDKILIFDVLSPNKVDAIIGETEPQLINTLMNKVNQIANKSNYIPTKTSDLVNDSEFVTRDDIPTKLSEFTDDVGFVMWSETPSLMVTKTSQLTNDSNFAYKTDIPTKVSELTNDMNYWCIYDYQPLADALNDMGYVRTDNNFTDELSFFLSELCSIAQKDAYNIPNEQRVNHLIDTKLGVIENGSY